MHEWTVVLPEHSWDSIVVKMMSLGFGIGSPLVIPSHHLCSFLDLCFCLTAEPMVGSPCFVGGYVVVWVMGFWVEWMLESSHFAGEHCVVGVGDGEESWSEFPLPFWTC